MIELSLEPPAITADMRPNGSLKSRENRLLALLSTAERRFLERAMSRVEFRQGEHLFRSAERDFVYFPLESTVVRFLQVDKNSGNAVEVGVVGREGLIGLHILLNAPNGPISATQVQIPGPALALPALAAVERYAESNEFRQMVLGAANLLLGQFAQAALCSHAHSVEERLARWLLETLDRTDCNLLPLTHKMVARMLGVRRASLTLSAGIMKEAGLINIKRGRVEVLNRKRLEKMSCGCYAAIKALHRSIQRNNGGPGRGALPG